MNPDPALAPATPPAAPVVRANAFAVVTHVFMFVAFGWFMSRVADFKAVFDNLGAEMPIPTAMLRHANDAMAAIGLPIWTLAIAFLVLDVVVYWQLERRGRFQAAHNWMWIVAAAILPVTLVIQQTLYLPLVKLIESLK